MPNANIPAGRASTELPIVFSIGSAGARDDPKRSASFGFDRARLLRR